MAGFDDAAAADGVAGFDPTLEPDAEGVVGFEGRLTLESIAVIALPSLQWWFCSGRDSSVCV